MTQGDQRTIELGTARLVVRRCLALRERAAAGGICVYLSLLDDEIDDRWERFLSRCGDATPSAQGWAANAPELEPTDGVVLLDGSGGVTVLRGCCCAFPLFFSQQSTGLAVTTELPLLEGSSRLSKSGLLSAMAAPCLQGSYEPNAWTETPLHGWQRIRRGTLTSFDGSGAPRERAIPIADSLLDVDKVLEAVGQAFAAYTFSQRGVASAVLELSGGIDSTLAGAAARHEGLVFHGVSVEFPYYEFRFEATVQRAVAEALGITRSVLAGVDLFPYAPSEAWPRFDEPSVFITGIRHAQAVALFAKAQRATRVYTGHGGDALFSTDLSSSERSGSSPADALFSRAARRAVRAAVHKAQDTAHLRRDTGCFVYDARQDVWVKEAFGITVRSPFSDLAVVRAARLWSRYCAAKGIRPEKTILERALPGLLPQAVVQRKGKVAYNGVWARAYALHADHIARSFEQAAALLEHVGISPSWLQRRVRQLEAGDATSDKEVLAAYALCRWLLAWGFERVGDANWD
ncbi:MAG TPA: asparagine synthase-related protein [Polyangiaceae bacterium]